MNEPRPGEGATILVVDDEPALIDMTRDALEREGFTILEAVNGMDAVQKTRDLLPDLVLLDANPLDAIANARRITAVIADGRLFDRKTLDDLLAQLAATNATH